MESVEQRLERVYQSRLPYSGYYSPVRDAVCVVLRVDRVSAALVVHDWFGDPENTCDPLRRAAFWSHAAKTYGETT